MTYTDHPQYAAKSPDQPTLHERLDGFGMLADKLAQLAQGIAIRLGGSIPVDNTPARPRADAALDRLAMIHDVLSDVASTLHRIDGLVGASTDPAVVPSHLYEQVRG